RLSPPGVAAAAVAVDGDRPLDKRLAAAVQPSRVDAVPATPPAVTDGTDVLAGVDLTAYAAHMESLDRIALRAMLDCFRVAGLFEADSADSVHTLDDIYSATGAAPRPRRL